MKLMTRLGQWVAALAVAGSLMQAQAARPLVVDDLPGVPAQPTAYWNQVRSEQSAAAAVAQATQDEAANTFFTGKPYDADLQGYLFQYRTYRADVARWTSADPSGFPDGANGYVYAPVPISAIDFGGLWKIKLVAAYPTYADSATDVGNFNDYTLHVSSTFITSIGVGQTADSVSATGTAVAQYMNEGQLEKMATITNLGFTVSVDANGKLTAIGGGTDLKASDGLVLGIGSSQEGKGTTSLTLVYQIGSTRSPENISGLSATFKGGTLNLQGSQVQVRGSVSFLLQAVEE